MTSVSPALARPALRTSTATAANMPSVFMICLPAGPSISGPLRAILARRAGAPSSSLVLLSGSAPRLQVGLHSLARDGVGTLVLGMAGMAAHPDPLHVMGCSRRLQALPEIDVLDRLLVGGL